MEDIIRSIKAYLYDRHASPLIGAFIVSWSIWNYRVPLVIFAGKERSVEEIFSQIDKLLASFTVNISDVVIPINGAFYHGLIMPAIITLSYIYVYPFLAKPVYEHSLRKQKELREVKQQEENNRQLSVEDSRELYRRLSELQVKHSSDVDSYNKQIASLNQKIKEMGTELSVELQKADRLDEVHFDDINDADPEEFDNQLAKNIESISDGDFQLSGLFTDEQWTSLKSSLKQAIGKRLKTKVDRGDFPRVSVSHKGSGNQQIYSKKSTGLSPVEDKILQLFSGLKSGHGHVEQDIHKNIGGHIEAVRVYLYDLEEKDYIGQLGETEDNESLYMLTPKGRKYLVQNNLLPSENTA